LHTDGAIEERAAAVEVGMAHLAEAALSGDLEPEAVCDRVVRILPPDRLDDVALLALKLDR
jgi:hypothetical protein